MPIRYIIITEIQLRLGIQSPVHGRVGVSGICSALTSAMTENNFCDLLLALCVKVDTLNATRNLIEANIVEAFEARTANCSDAVIWDEEVFLPAHEQMLLLHPILGD